MFLSITMAFSYQSKAQVTFLHSTYNSTGSLTTSLLIDTMHYTLTKGYNLVTFQPFITRDSGTLSGKCYLDYSVIGSSTSWILIDSVTLSNAATSTGALTKAIPARYWRIRTVIGATAKATTSAKLQTD